MDSCGGSPEGQGWQLHFRAQGHLTGQHRQAIGHGVTSLREDAEVLEISVNIIAVLLLLLLLLLYYFFFVYLF